MIPKIIHYCWYGGRPLPKLAKQCIASWKKFCPDYEIKEWNEENSPLHLFPFAEQAIKAEKWAFVSDVIRLYVLQTEGGIYMDTDVELTKPLDDFLHHPAFTGYERDSNMLQTAIFGAIKNNQWITNWLKIYQDKEFNANKNIMASLVNNRMISSWMTNNGYILDGCHRKYEDVVIYPKDFFCPMSYGSHFIEKTPNTVCIHYYTFSWSEPETIKGHIKKIVVNIIGEKQFRTIVNRIRQLKK